MKLCNHCNKTKPYSEFYSRQRKTKISYGYYCISCHLEKMRANYKGDSDKYKDRAKTARKKFRKFVIAQKQKPCADCGVQYPHYVMDFDHLEPSKKSFNVGTWRNQSMEKVVEEIAKCELVCSNCHRERTHGTSQKDLTNP